MCKNEKRTHGTAATGVPVAEMLASEARRDPPTVDVNLAYGDPSLCLFPGDRSRESCGTWQLPQTITLTAVLRLYRHSRCSCIDIGHIAADELRRTIFAEQMCLTNADKCA